MKQFGPGRTAAAINYAANENKSPRIFTIGLPAFSRHALADHVSRYEASLPRKDSRVAETFIIGFPLSMTGTHREEAAMRFMWEMTGHGQSKAWAILHENDPGNPHMHVGYLDRGSDGRPVQMMTGTPRARIAKGLDPTGTEFARRMWEKAGNSVAEEFGLEWRLDRRSYAEQGLDKVPQKHRGWQHDHIPELSSTVAEPLALANDDSSEVHTEELPGEEQVTSSKLVDNGHELVVAVPSDAPIDQLEEAHAQAQESEQTDHFVEANEKVSEHSHASEPDMATEQQMRDIAEGVRAQLERDRVDPDVAPTREGESVEPEGEGRVVAGKEPYGVAGKVNRFTQLHARLRELQAAQQKLRDLQTAYEQHKTAHRTHERDLQRAITQSELRAADADQAEVELRTRHQTRSGRLKGFNLLGWRVLGRKEADAALLAAEKAAIAHSRASRDAELQSSVTRQAFDTANESSKDLQRYAATLAAEQRYGTRAQMIESEKVLQRSEETALKGLSGAQVFEAMENGEITEEEALDACRALGDSAYVEMIEERLEQERER